MQRERERERETERETERQRQREKTILYTVYLGSLLGIWGVEFSFIFTSQRFYLPLLFFNFTIFINSCRCYWRNAGQKGPFGIYRFKQSNEMNYLIKLAIIKIIIMKAKRKISNRTLLENRKKVEYVSDGGNNCNWCSWYNHQRIGTRTGGFGNKRTSGEHPDYSIIEFRQNTEKSSGDFRRLDVTQTPLKKKKHRLMLVWKNRKRVNNNYNNCIYEVHSISFQTFSYGHFYW